MLGHPVDGWITAGQRERGSSGGVVGHGLGGPPLLHLENKVYDAEVYVTHREGKIIEQRGERDCK